MLFHVAKRTAAVNFCLSEAKTRGGRGRGHNLWMSFMDGPLFISLLDQSLIIFITQLHSFIPPSPLFFELF